MTTTTAHHTTPMSCTCDDWKYSDSIGYQCEHMKSLGKRPVVQTEAPKAEIPAKQADKGPKPMTEAPATTAASCAKYRSRAWTCDCPNRDKKGGDYIDEKTGEHVCKHMANLRLGRIDEIVVKSIETGKNIAQLTAESAVRFEKATGKPADPRLAIIIEIKSYRKGSPIYDYAKKRLAELNDKAAAMLDLDSPHIRLILAGARSTDAAVKTAAKVAADDLGTSLAALVRRADALAAAQEAA